MPLTAIKLISALGLVAVIAACQSHTPDWIVQGRDTSPSIAQVRAQAPDNLQQQVLWGGVILETSNLQSASQLTVVGYPLDRAGRPAIEAASPGRFIAHIEGFAEPEVYAARREITVKGAVLEWSSRPVGEYAYAYPVIRVDAHKLWPRRVESAYLAPGPYWYDPWYDHHRPFFNPYLPPRIIIKDSGADKPD